MKKIAAILCLGALATGAFAQGVVNFGNTSGTQVTQGPAGNTQAIPGSATAKFYFGLLTGSAAAGPFTFSGLYATNSVAAGRFVENGAQVPGWLPGTTKFYEVAGWSASLGTTFQASWLTSNPGGFGLSTVGSGTAGGTDASGNAFPPLPLFGGATGIQSGFNLTPGGGVITPEPSSMALAGLGAAALMIFRRRK